MNTFLLILFFLIGYIFFYLIYNHIHINWSSFFKKGFKKFDNTFRALLLRAENNGKRQDIFVNKVTYGISRQRL